MQHIAMAHEGRVDMLRKILGGPEQEFTTMAPANNPAAVRAVFDGLKARTNLAR